MDDYDFGDLDADAFDIVDFESPQSASEDSDWPEELSSPGVVETEHEAAPELDDEQEEGLSNLQYYGGEVDEAYDGQADGLSDLEYHPGEAEEDYDGHEDSLSYLERHGVEAEVYYEEHEGEDSDLEHYGEGVEEDHNGEEGSEDQDDDYSGYDEDQFMNLLDSEDEAGDSGAESVSHWDSDALSPASQDSESPAPGRQNFSEILSRLPDSAFELDDEPLFVEQDPPSLPPIGPILSQSRRNNSRIIGLGSEFDDSMDNARRNFARERSFHEPSRAGPARPSRQTHHRQNSRHHPYNMPQNMSRDRGQVAERRTHRNYDGNRAIHDELVAVEVQPARGLLRRNRNPARVQAEVIDLTAEPDSPEVPRAAAASRLRGSNPLDNANRHPRRQMSMNLHPPSLSRSDGSILENNANVIDLTLDDPPAPPPLPLQLPRRDNQQHQHHHHHHHHPQGPFPPPAMPPAQPIDLDAEEVGALFSIVRRLPRPIDLFNRLVARPPPEVEVQIIGNPANMDNPLAGNSPNLNYRGNGYNAGGAPKPAHVPPPPPREGFTRSTGGEGDDVIVCPSCEAELQYDPEADANTPPAKKARTKKDREEHHFWALKECGHVYCKNCYDQRRIGNKNPRVRFRREAENNRKVFCAVNSCPTEATNKGSWVGLFL